MPRSPPRPGRSCSARATSSHIGQGVYTGQLTARETGRLEQREGAINATRQADLAANGGRLTPGEYRGLNGRENRLSNSIYADKHNGAT